MKAFKTIIAGVALLAATAMSAQEPTAEDYMRLVERSDSAIAAADFQLAKQLITDAMTAHPDNPNNTMLLYNLGVVRSYLGDSEGALEALNAAHEQAPKSTKVLISRARVNMTSGHRKESIRDYEMVMALDSTIVEPYFYRGLYSLFNGDIVQTDKDFAMLKRLDPEGELTVHSQAITYTVTGQPKEAADCYRRLVAVRQSEEYFTGLIENLIAIDALDEASENIAEAMRLYPEDAELYIWRALLNKKRYRNDESKADAARAIQLGATSQEVQTVLNSYK